MGAVFSWWLLFQQRSIINRELLSRRSGKVLVYSGHKDSYNDQVIATPILSRKSRAF
jgi:hypothetical protein